MRWLIHIFNKSFVQRFYAAHFLIFLFVALVMFGFADGNTLVRFHYYILLAAFSRPFTLIWLWLAFTIYAVNVLRYSLNTLSKEEFHFLYISNTAPARELFKALYLAFSLMNAPILIYSLIGVAIALKNFLYLTAFLGLLGCLIIPLISAFIVYRRMLNIHRSNVLRDYTILPQLRLRPGILSVLIQQITHESKMAVLVTKVFSCAVIYGAHYEWGSFNYDIRWMQAAMAISIPAQGVLIYQIWSFQTTYLSFTRNFPTPISQRWLTMLNLIIILLIPEILLLASYCFRFNIMWQLPVYLLYAISLPMLLYAMLFTRGFNQESFNGFLFAIGLATFFITLFGFTWLLALAFLPISYLIFKESFYLFEKQ